MGVVRAKDLPLKVLMPRPPPFAIPPLHHADFGINPRSLAPIWSWRDLSASSVSVMARRKLCSSAEIRKTCKKDGRYI